MTKHSLGWIGMGRMGYPMAERLLKAGHSVAIWNRTRAKAEPLAKKGGRIVDHPSELAGKDIVFTMVSTGKDLEQVYFGENGLRRQCLRAAAEAPGRLLLDRRRTVRGDPRAAEAAGLRIRQRPRLRQRQMRQGRQTLHGGVGPEGGVRPGAALSC